jgi:hypothetical protein
LVRFRQAVDGPLGPKNCIMLSPTGLIELQWNLAALPTTELQLSEVVVVVSRFHGLVHSDAYLQLYQTRRLERWRRVDWRIGINSRAVPRNGGNMESWTDLVTPISLPRMRIDEPHPTCPLDGYGISKLTAVKRDSRPANVLTPVLEELLSAAGYTNAAEIRRCASELSS